MANNNKETLKLWLKAREETALSHKHIQMARELNMKPEKLKQLTPKHNESWKAPLAFFIEECYWKRFKRAEPDKIEELEELIARVKT